MQLKHPSFFCTTNFLNELKTKDNTKEVTTENFRL